MEFHCHIESSFVRQEMRYKRDMYLFICLTEVRITQLFIVMCTTEIKFLMWSLDSLKKKLLHLLQKELLFVQSLRSSKLFSQKVPPEQCKENDTFVFPTLYIFGWPQIPLQFIAWLSIWLFAHLVTYVLGYLWQIFWDCYEIHNQTLANYRG